MEAHFIFMGLLMMSMGYNYDKTINFHPRYRTQFRSTAFGRPILSKMQISRAPFRVTQFQRPPFRNRFPQLYREKYLRERSAYLSPWLRKNDPEITTTKIPTEEPKYRNASLSIFRILKTEQTNAKLVTNETKHPYIARVVATPNGAAPVVCTAACIEERIFVTAATCLLNAKVYYTRVHYQHVALQPLAFVLPSKPTKDMFHDLGLIVVDRNFTKPWQIIVSYFKLNPQPQPDDDTFAWTKGIPWWSNTVVGYVGEASEQEYRPNIEKNTVYSLYELEMQSSAYLCNYLYNQNLPRDKFFVPCYSVCDLTEFSQNLSKCYNYLAGEGHVVTGSFSGLLFGIATWGGQYKSGLNKPPLPVGMATLHSFAFEEDFECARKIAKAPEASERFDTFCQ